MTRNRINIFKESSPEPLEEKITIIVSVKDTKKYLDLLQTTWPNTRIEEIKSYG